VEAFELVSPAQRWQAFMDAASDRVQLVARQDQPSEDAECARKILLTPRSWSRWEQELGTALRPVAKFRSHMLQVRALRQVNFSWVHRAAPFRYLRNARVRGQRRRQLVAALHDGQFVGYDRAMVAEHESYLRSVCHGFCAGHIGESLLGDALYRESMRRYQTLYMEYFRAFGVFTCGREGRAATVSQRLLPLMKRQLADLRRALLEYPLHVDWLQREADLRKPTGDTQKFRRLDFNLD
jgi:hypothetical protein